MHVRKHQKTIFGVADPGCLYRIPDPNFSSGQKARSRILDPDPQRFLSKYLFLSSDRQSSDSFVYCSKSTLATWSKNYEP
jgi:hypothetical protein